MSALEFRTLSTNSLWFTKNILETASDITIYNVNSENSKTYDVPNYMNKIQKNVLYNNRII